MNEREKATIASILAASLTNIQNIFWQLITIKNIFWRSFNIHNIFWQSINIKTFSDNN